MSRPAKHEAIDEAVVHAADQAADQATADAAADATAGASADAAMDDLYRLTPAQQGMLVHGLRAPGSGLYVTQVRVELRGAVDRALLERAWAVLVSRHAALRTAFVWRGLDEPLQAVLPAASLPVEAGDWSDASAAELPARRAAFLAADRARGFDLGAPPLSRLSLFRLPGGSWDLYWTCHHLIVDGWSQGILLAELSAAYAALRRGTVPELGPPARFGDYVDRVHAPPDDETARFWREALAGFAGPTPLGIDATAANAAPVPAHVTATLPRETAARLAAFCRAERLTLSTVMLGAWSLLLARLAGERQVTAGVTLSGRSVPVPGVDRMVGNLICALPVRVDCDGGAGATLRAWLASVQQRLLALHRHAGASPYDIRRWAGLAEGTVLFENLLVIENSPLDTARAGSGDGLEIVDLETRDENHDALTLTVYPSPAEVRLDAGYDRGRLDERAVRRLLRHFAALVDRLTAGDPAASVDALLAGAATAGDAGELGTFELTGPAPPPAAGPVELLVEQARRAPDAVALIAGDRRVSYGELARRTLALAGELRRAGVGAETVVPVIAARGDEAVVGLMAVAAAGGAWLPLEPSQPARRLADICARVRPPVVLLSAGAPREVVPAGARAIDISADRPASAAPAPAAPAAPAPEQAAYVIFTSGSTGQPNGVVVEHGALAYVTACWRTAYALDDEPARLLQVGSFAADVFTGDWIKALLSGGTLVICPDAARSDPRAVFELLRAHEITLFESVPGFIVPFFEWVRRKGQRLPRLRTVILGADTLRAAELRRLCEAFPGVRFVNGYGLTEATIESSLHEATVAASAGSNPSRAGLAPIGRPFPGTRALVLDEAMHRRPLGTVGELYLAGPGLARGYLGEPALTEARFPRAPWGERLLRTGDLARWHEDGFLEYFGRRDDMVKVRGYRVDLGEVENALCAVPGVSGVAVLAGAPGEGLRAFVVLEPWTDLAQVRRAAGGALPEYMIPSRFEALAELPRNSNGKIDRRALRARPEPEAPGAGRAPGEGAAPPADPTERALLEIWRDVLGHARIAVDDTFMNVGGTSLKIIQLANAIAERLDVDLEVAELFAHPTVRSQAARIGDLLASRRPRSAP